MKEGGRFELERDVSFRSKFPEVDSSRGYTYLNLGLSPSPQGWGVGASMRSAYQMMIWFERGCSV